MLMAGATQNAVPAVTTSLKTSLALNMIRTCQKEVNALRGLSARNRSVVFFANCSVKKGEGGFPGI
jgi:hypothetical protein